MKQTLKLGLIHALIDTASGAIVYAELVQGNISERRNKMKHLITAFLLTIVVFITSASGDIAPRPGSAEERRTKEIEDTLTSLPGSEDCVIDADVKVHIKPYTKPNRLLQKKEAGVLAEVTANFDMSCQKAFTNCGFGFPMYVYHPWYEPKSDDFDFKVSIDGQALPIRKEKWRYSGAYRCTGYIWKSNIKPETKHRISVSYSIILDSSNEKELNFMLPLAGTNFYKYIQDGRVTFTADESLYLNYRRPYLNHDAPVHLKICREHEIVWEIFNNKKPRFSSTDLDEIWLVAVGKYPLLLSEKYIKVLTSDEFPPQEMKNCSINTDVKVHLKPQDSLSKKSVIANVIAEFDIFCQKTDNTNCELRFPVYYTDEKQEDNRGNPNKEENPTVSDFQVDIDGKPSLPIKNEAWHLLAGYRYSGYTLKWNFKPEIRHRISVRYSILMREKFNYEINKNGIRYKYEFVFPLFGINFFHYIKDGTVSVTADESLTIKRMNVGLSKKDDPNIFKINPNLTSDRYDNPNHKCVWHIAINGDNNESVDNIETDSTKKAIHKPDGTSNKTGLPLIFKIVLSLIIELFVLTVYVLMFRLPKRTIAIVLFASYFLHIIILSVLSVSGLLIRMIIIDLLDSKLIFESLFTISEAVLIYLIARKIWLVPDLRIKHAVMISLLTNIATFITSSLLK